MLAGSLRKKLEASEIIEAAVSAQKLFCGTLICEESKRWLNLYSSSLSFFHPI
jgi:hypothetical protein